MKAIQICRKHNTSLENINKYLFELGYETECKPSTIIPNDVYENIKEKIASYDIWKIYKLGVNKCKVKDLLFEEGFITERFSNFKCIASFSKKKYNPYFSEKNSDIEIIMYKNYFELTNNTLHHLLDIIQNNMETTYPNTGIFKCPWEYIEIHNKAIFFFHPLSSLKKINQTPFLYFDNSAIYCLNEIKDYLNIYFGDIQVRAYNGNVVEILSKFHLSDIIEIINDSSYILIDKSNRYIDKQIKNGILEVIEKSTILNKYKSCYIKHLCHLHLSNNKIYITKELRYINRQLISKQTAIAFIVQQTDLHIWIVFENIESSTASFVFIVNSKLLNNSIMHIISYFSSSMDCKRLNIHLQKEIFLQHGIIDYYKVYHKDLSYWKSNLVRK